MPNSHELQSNWFDLCNLWRAFFGLSTLPVLPLIFGSRREVKDHANDPERHGSYQARSRDGEYPGPHDSSGDTPLDRGQPTRGADTDDGAGDCVRG